jgi:hypothetical protein
MKAEKYLKWLRSFVKDKDVIVEIELLQIKEGLNRVFEEDYFTITALNTQVWESDSTFKNPYNYETIKLDKEPNKKK